MRNIEQHEKKIIFMLQKSNKIAAFLYSFVFLLKKVRCFIGINKTKTYICDCFMRNNENAYY